jgi:arginine deiminase
MIQSHPIHVYSEIGKLKTVILHRPGHEVERLVPRYMDRMLFDDIPFLKKMQAEHDAFAQILQDHGVEILYLKDLVLQSLTDATKKSQFVEQFLEHTPHRQHIKDLLRNYLLDLTAAEMIDALIGGIAKNELAPAARLYLSDYVNHREPFYLPPLPNLYFMRDPVAFIGQGASVNCMLQSIRKREPLLLNWVLHWHPRFAGWDIPRWYHHHLPFPLEGGDILVLSPEVVAIGISERTSAEAIESLAEALLNQSSFVQVMAIEIPKQRAFMHLDTVFTMVNHDQFTIYPGIENQDGEMNIFYLYRDKMGKISIQRRSRLLDALKEVLHLSDLDLIPCGGGDPVIAAREQWNDGSNTLAIAPGVVVTYDRNVVTNETLRQHGITVIETPSSELARGRGGPRCMSMPLVREVI